MEAKTMHYPVYIPDQFLTSENLNDTSNFLERGERATRYMLIGNGIVTGLNVLTTTQSGNRISGISVSPGFGATADGNLLTTGWNCAEKKGAINLRFATAEVDLFKITIPSTDKRCLQEWLTGHLSHDKKITDENGEPVTDAIIDKWDCIELFAEKPDERIDRRDIKELGGFDSQHITACALVFFADIYDFKYNNCQQGDCNDKGTNRHIRGRFLLVPLKLLKALNKPHSQLQLLHTARATKLFAGGNTADFFKKIIDTWKRSVEMIAQKMEQIAANVSFGFNAGSIDLARKSLLQSVNVNSSNLLLYYLGYVNDLQQAINEYITAYNHLAALHHYYDNRRLERVLVLNNLSSTNAIPDAYRYYWLATEEKNRKEAIRQLEKLYNRISDLVKAFTDIPTIVRRYDTRSLNVIKIIPSKEPHLPLGEKAIPYYYDMGKEKSENGLAVTWNAQTLGGQYGMCLHYFNELNPPLIDFNIAAYNFFRIEGHLGQNAAKAKDHLEGLVRNFDLPIQVLTLALSKSNWDNIRDQFEKYKENYRELLKKIPRQEIPRYSEKFSKLEDIDVALSQTSYYNIERIDKLIKDTASFVGVVNASQKVQAQRDGGTSDNTIRIKTLPRIAWDKTEAAKVSKTIEEAKLTASMTNLLKEYKLAAAATTLSLRDIAGLEYQGGVCKGGTFVLVTDGTNIIGDGSVPYYIMVDGLRIRK